MYKSVLLQKVMNAGGMIDMAKRVVVKATELQRSSGKVLKRAALGAEHLVIERAGYPVAVMISYQEYEQLMKEHEQRIKRLQQLAGQIGAEAERLGITEEDLIEELEKDKQALYQETYGDNTA